MSTREIKTTETAGAESAPQTLDDTPRDRVCVRTPTGEVHCGEPTTREGSSGRESTREDKTS